MPTLARMPRHAAHRSSDFGERLKRLRQARDLTQQQLADALGCSQRAIVYYEKDGKYPPAATVVRLAALFGVSSDDLMAEADAQPPKRSTAAPDLLNDPGDRRLWRQFRKLKQLSSRDRAAVLRLLNVAATNKARREVRTR